MMLAAVLVAFVVGHAVPTTCDLDPAHGGYYHDGQVQLSPLVCAGLSRYATNRQLGLALFTVAHEAQHARGIVDEHAADCAALPWVARLARRFFAASRARQLALTDVARSFHDSLPAPYGGACA